MFSFSCFSLFVIKFYTFFRFLKTVNLSRILIFFIIESFFQTFNNLDLNFFRNLKILNSDHFEILNIFGFEQFFDLNLFKFEIF
jgi:hypothetical protein